jgi:hypothetical protein
MTWNYRIIEKPCPVDGEYYRIHECHYHSKGDTIPHSWSVTPVYPGGLSPESLRADLDLMARAFDKPIL